MSKDLIKYKNIASVISIVMLLLAIPTFWPYGYYILLRWIITASALFLAWIAYDLEKVLWVVLMGLVAILFNPLIPIHLAKSGWVLIDFVSAILFFLAAYSIKTIAHKHSGEEE